MLRPVFGMNFFEGFSDFSTLEYDIPSLCKKSLAEQAIVNELKWFRRKLNPLCFAVSIA